MKVVTYMANLLEFNYLSQVYLPLMLEAEKKTVYKVCEPMAWSFLQLEGIKSLFHIFGSNLSLK